MTIGNASSIVSPDPSNLAEKVRDMQARAEVCNALMGGTTGMREQGTRYLPIEPAETPTAWASRISRTVLFPAFEKAINTMLGKPFGQPIAIEDDVPVAIKEALENVDLAGRDFDTFSRDLFKQTLQDGIGWVLVDYPRVPTDLTVADERELQVQPYLVHIPLANVLGWKSKTISGIPTLTQFRYLEIVETDDGQWGSKDVKRVRVLEPGQVTVYQQGADAKWDVVPEESGPMTLPQIPLVTFYTGRTAWMQAQPPMESLAWLNVEHWQSRSDQRHILHFARVPLLFGKGIERAQDGQIVIGPDRLITGGPESDLKVVEHSGAAIEAGRQDLQDIEDAMRRVAGELLTGKVQKTATETDREAGEGEATLKQWVRTFEDALELCLDLMAQWLNEPSGGRLCINTEWDDEELQADMMTALTNLHDKGLMSKDSVLWNLKQGGKLPPDRTVEEEKTLIEAEGPSLGALATSALLNPPMVSPAGATDGVDL